jgi:hypothetical protein
VFAGEDEFERNLISREEYIFTRIAAGVKPVIVCEFTMFREVD